MPARSREIVVTGLGAVSCLGNSVAETWAALLNGRCGIGPLAGLDAERHRIRHAGEVRDPPTPEEASLDPATRFALRACREAAEQAGLAGAQRRKTALILGSNFGAMAATERFLSGDAGAACQSGLAGPGEVVARTLGLGGPRADLSLSCASGNAAIAGAVDRIRTGEAEIVIAGGYDAISETVWAGLCALRAMTSDTLRPFDRRRDGTIFSEGAGALVIESASSAARRGAVPLAVVLGCATTNDAYHMTHPEPVAAGIARAMRAALADAGVSPERVQHVNAHATGTKLNDALETRAIKEVFGAHARNLLVNGVKSMLGHAMGAASSLEAIAAVLAIREGIVPPTIHLEEPDPECDLDYVPLQARKAEVRVALNNSAGFGGCNACVVFGAAEEGGR